jgi:hypothetical protein
MPTLNTANLAKDHLLGPSQANMIAGLLPGLPTMPQEITPTTPVTPKRETGFYLN